jgi:hypothetical protein
MKKEHNPSNSMPILPKISNNINSNIKDQEVYYKSLNNQPVLYLSYNIKN